MKKWITGAALVCAMAAGQLAVAQHDSRWHDSADATGHMRHDVLQYARYDRAVVGGHFQQVHGKRHYRRHYNGYWRDRHAHGDGCGHRRDHLRHQQRGYHRDHHAHGHRHQHRRKHGHRHHDRHGYHRSERRISQVIRVF